MTTSTETTQLLSAVDKLLPAINAARGELDAPGALPDWLIAGLADAGVLRMSLPRSLGGLETDPLVTLDVLERLSWADGGVGWVAAIASATSGFVASRVPRDVAASIWSDPNIVMCGTIGMPAGVATPVDGGYRVTGRWPFGSGSYHSDWLASACNVKAEDAADGAEPAPPTQLVVVTPIRDCQLQHNWDVVGLRGTGSTDYVIDDVFVPEGCAFPRERAPIEGGPLYRHRFYLLGHAAHALGIARRAVETFEELARVKPLMRADRVLAGRPSAQSDVAQAQALVAMASAYLNDVVAELWDTVMGGEPLSLKQQGRARLVIVSCTRNAVRAVDLVYEAAGASSIYESSPLARCFRDVHVASQHAMVQMTNYELAGQTILGVTPRVPVF